MFIAFLTESYDKAKVRVFGDAEFEQEPRYVHAISIIDYFGQRVSAVFKQGTYLPGSLIKNNMGLKERQVQRLKRLATVGRSRHQRSQRDLENRGLFSSTRTLKALEQFLSDDGPSVQFQARMIHDLRELRHQLDALETVIVDA